MADFEPSTEKAEKFIRSYSGIKKMNAELDDVETT